MKNLIRMCRIDNWFKNIFIFPGVLFAGVLTGVDWGEKFWPLAACVFAACLAASANYVMNEYVDAETDRYHPIKRSRAAAINQVSVKSVLMVYFFLAICSLVLAGFINHLTVYATSLLLIAGILYNIKPIRLKDRAYLDVLSESLNNPIRLLIGWFAVTDKVLPPSSFVMGYWMAGAFLMAVKRFAEFRSIGKDVAVKYRISFSYYTENSLLISSFAYAVCAAFFLGVFLVKYRIELLITFPFLTYLFAWYLKIGFKENSAVQHPEKMYIEVEFIIYCLILTVLFGVLIFLDVPWMCSLLNDALVQSPI